MIVFVLIGGVIASPSASAQNKASMSPLPDTLPMINVDGRHAVSLDGEWRAIIDPYETGYQDYRGNIDHDGFFRDATPKDKSDRIEYAFDTAGTLNVPGDWNTQRPELFYYEGTIWYRRKFDYTRKVDKRAFLYFGAANYDARVYLNGEELGRHVGGFTPFQFEITNTVKDGENSLVVKVDNSRHSDAVPMNVTDWWNYGGLTRSVLLIETPMTFIRDYALYLHPDRDGAIEGWVQLDGPDRRQVVSVHLVDVGSGMAIKANMFGRAKIHRGGLAIQRWSPENPRQYQVWIRSGEDSVEEKIGFRRIEVKGRDILLNGKPIFLRGICLHEERPAGDGRAFNAEHAETQLAWAKELNCNFVRLAHYPHNDAMIRAAERMGLLVWAEIPVYWGIEFDNEDVYANAERQLSETIARDRNRACVAMWSVANETPLSDARLAFLRRLIDAAHRLDPSRPVTAALEVHYRDANTIEINDPLGAYLDILGCNEYIGWYDGAPAKADGITWTTPYNKPLVISEFGAGAKFGRHGDADARWTEEYQADVFLHQTQMLDRIDFLRGVSPWILKDFRSPRRLLPEIQDNWNRKGLVSEKGERKKAFNVLKEWYAERRKAGK
ncbi:MAG: beta galactosidase jelly roll domain-containing protein [Phycisphaerales bacterium]|nr:beta galactosidase jelly roll domain-containing protein [Phycisphaerales bacterium]MCB9856985.1 beta galactosidase jelly roll domain-containing protein [Phycisphaerales bacterium]MCB9861888.1 beta galactosidase jelly roll domain-containing protein [Phycisphaerales bacterium]